MVPGGDVLQMLFMKFQEMADRQRSLLKIVTSAEMLLISQELKMYLGIFPLLNAGDLTRGVSGPSGTHSDVVRNLWGSHFRC